MSKTQTTTVDSVGSASRRHNWWSILKFYLIAGVGQFADSYQNISIGLVIPMISAAYFADGKDKFSTVQQDIIKGGLSLGMIIGQLSFGLLGDAFGRHKIYGSELILTMLGTIMVITAPPQLGSKGLTAWLACWRVVAGFGIGGDYPMTSALSAEQNLNISRSRLVLGVFFLHGLGTMAAAVVYIVLLAAFKSAIMANVWYVQWVWRLLLGIGLVPCALTLYARLRIRETKAYREYVAAENSRRGLKDQFRDFRVYFSEWRHLRTLIAVSGVWFLFDIAFYGINLNQSIVLSQIGYGKGSNQWQTLQNTAVGNIIVCLAGFLPGYFVGIFLPDVMGRVRQQYITCFICAILYAVWAGVLNKTSTGGLMSIFTLSQFFLNGGPASTTFLIPAEVFPTRVRGTAHGIAAASGKAGAVITAFTFGSAQKAMGLQGCLGLFAGIMVMCAVWTFWTPESKGLSLADIENGRLYGEQPTVVSTPEETASEDKV